jgi:hypothetical protein
VPLTRAHGNGTALQFEVELTDLDQLDQFHSRGVGSAEETGNWMHASSEVLAAPPCVEILRFEGSEGRLAVGDRSVGRKSGSAFRHNRCGSNQARNRVLRGSARAAHPIHRPQSVGTSRAL